MSPGRLQDDFSKTIVRLPRRLQDVAKTYLQGVFKMSWMTKKCYAEDVLKTSSMHALKMSSRFVEDQQIFTGIYSFTLSWYIFFRAKDKISLCLSSNKIYKFASGRCRAAYYGKFCHYFIVSEHMYLTFNKKGPNQ